MKTLLLTAGAILGIGWGATTYALHEQGMPSTLTEWIGLFSFVLLLTSFGTGWVVCVWWMLQANALVGDGEGWQQRYRDQTNPFHRGEEFKTERWIVIISFSTFYTVIFALSIAQFALHGPANAHLDTGPAR